MIINQVFFNKFVALGDTVEWRTRAFILFNKEIFHARLRPYAGKSF